MSTPTVSSLPCHSYSWDPPDDTRLSSDVLYLDVEAATPVELDPFRKGRQRVARIILLDDHNDVTWRTDVGPPEGFTDWRRPYSDYKYKTLFVPEAAARGLANHKMMARLQRLLEGKTVVAVNVRAVKEWVDVAEWHELPASWVDLGLMATPPGTHIPSQGLPGLFKTHFGGPNILSQNYYNNELPVRMIRQLYHLFRNDPVEPLISLCPQ